MISRLVASEAARLPTHRTSTSSTSTTAPAGRFGRPQVASATDYFNRLSNRARPRSASDRRGPLLRRVHEVRPQGGEGMLAVSLEGFAKYHGAKRGPGSNASAERADYARREAPRALRGSFAPSSPDRTIRKTRADAAKMRDDMARHKPPSGPLASAGSGRLIDLEFAVHAQLVHAKARSAARTFHRRLAKEGLIDATTTQTCGAEPNACRHAAGRSRQQRAARKSRGLVASLCGTDWDSLLAAHDAARQRRALCNREGSAMINEGDKVRH